MLESPIPNKSLFVKLIGREPKGEVTIRINRIERGLWSDFTLQDSKGLYAFSGTAAWRRVSDFNTGKMVFKIAVGAGTAVMSRSKYNHSRIYYTRVRALGGDYVPLVIENNMDTDQRRENPINLFYLEDGLRVKVASFGHH